MVMLAKTIYQSVSIVFFFQLILTSAVVYSNFLFMQYFLIC